MAQLNNKKIKHYLEMAKAASKDSDFPRHKLGAVLIYKGSLLACGCNSRRTSPIQKMYNRERDYDVNISCGLTNSIHAEIACLSKVKYLDIQFDKATLFVFRETKDGHKALARPCEACSAMIRDLGIKNVVYTTSDGYCHEVID